MTAVRLRRCRESGTVVDDRGCHPKQRTEAMRQCQPYSWGFASLLLSCEVSSATRRLAVTAPRVHAPSKARPVGVCQLPFDNGVLPSVYGLSKKRPCHPVGGCGGSQGVLPLIPRAGVTCLQRVREKKRRRERHLPPAWLAWSMWSVWLVWS